MVDDPIGEFYTALEDALRAWNSLTDDERNSCDDDDRRVIGHIKDWLYG